MVKSYAQVAAHERPQDLRRITGRPDNTPIMRTVQNNDSRTVVPMPATSQLPKNNTAAENVDAETNHKNKSSRNVSHSRSPNGASTRVDRSGRTQDNMFKNQTEGHCTSIDLKKDLTSLALQGVYKNGDRPLKMHHQESNLINSSGKPGANRMKVRSHCAAFEGLADRYCLCCTQRSELDVQLRYDAIQVTVLAYQDYHAARSNRRISHWSALLGSRMWLERQGFHLRDVELKCIEAQQTAAFAQAQQLEYARYQHKSRSKTAADNSLGPPSSDLSATKSNTKCLGIVTVYGLDSGYSSLRSSISGSSDHSEDPSELQSNNRLPEPPCFDTTSIGIASHVTSPMPTIVDEIEPQINVVDHCEDPGSGTCVEENRAEPVDGDDNATVANSNTNPEATFAKADTSILPPSAAQKNRKKSSAKRSPKRLKNDQQKELVELVVAPREECKLSPYQSSLVYFPLPNGANLLCHKVKDIPEALFEASQIVKDRLVHLREMCLTSADAAKSMTALFACPISWDRDFELRCLSLLIFRNTIEQEERQKATLTFGQIRSEELHGVTNERIRLSCGKITASEHTAQALGRAEEMTKHSARLLSLKTSLVALLDHTIQQFHCSWHLVPDDRLSLLDNLKRKLNSLGGIFLIQGYQRRLGEGFRGIFLAFQQRHIADLHLHRAQLMHRPHEVDDVRSSKILPLEDVSESKQIDGSTQSLSQADACALETMSATG